MGGARPKAVVEDAGGLWIAKFGRNDDRWNHPRVEHGMLALARASGLNVAESRIETVGRRDVLLVRRFDRDRTDAGYPLVLYPEDADDGMYDGRFEANMIVCVESYVGALGGTEGVKLEQPVLITEHGPQVLSALPLDAAGF